MSDEHRVGLTRAERKEVEELAAPRSPVIHEVVRRQGEEELRRPNGSLFWSGVAAGVTMMASVIAQGALHGKLPEDAPWRDLVVAPGYCLGFLIVVLGRMQLFTEQTIVAVLPVAAEPSWRKVGGTVRLWSIVLVGNMAGAAAAAALNLHLQLVGADLLAAMLEVSGGILRRTPPEMLLQAIPAGFLVAAIAWLRASASGGEFWIVVTLSYAIALGGFTHVVVGAGEAFLLLFDGRIGVAQALGGIVLPALVGNIVGGTGLFALLAHAQVRQEL